MVVGVGRDCIKSGGSRSASHSTLDSRPLVLHTTARSPTSLKYSEAVRLKDLSLKGYRDDDLKHF